ncbi:hypothetical protein ADIARSV_2623 [Arcticibacter svalbardensis MN12-7]|uniref:DUF3800 domain-containing protein n=1 Tax=Arcticibacter svalbardensis MN12-7 TaxID=1150600 RepID=R9GQW3_9SPHI|nr:DUF3800 domain-containing protein [Arcticibacter svalbardensis]EOR94207.1 hypothetical protein ADIARSV_2623 [Arcticibacter svalbardensis MN12-7]
MPIYCDESGYTGSNLLVTAQPYFVYAALNAEEKEIEDFYNYLRAKYRLQGELKGANLVHTAGGKRAISELFNHFGEKVKIIFHHKKYALACKFFEYSYEPVIANKNTFFYQMRFNRFVAHLFYISFEKSENSAEKVFELFQELLLGNNVDGIFKIFRHIPAPNEILKLITTFTIIHKDAILDEIYTDGKIDAWILDLTHSALYDMLCCWGIEIDEMEVICDNSKPLEAAVNRYPYFYSVGLEKKFWAPFGETLPLNFTLAKPIVFETSKKSKGLQLADLFASAAFYSLKNPINSLSLTINNQLEKIYLSTESYCIMPQPETYLNPATEEFRFGIWAISALTKASVEDSENVLGCFEKEFYRKFTKTGTKIKSKKA